MRRCLVALTVVLAIGCVSEPTEPTDQEDQVEIPNVTVHAGSEVVTNDTAVLIGDKPFFDFGTRPRGIISNQRREFTYGGLYEQINDELVGESWYIDVGRSITTEMSGDTVYRRMLDFGDVMLEGVEAHRIEIDSTLVMPREDHIRVYENYILYRISFYGHRLYMDGSEVIFSDPPFYDRLAAGGAVELTGTGSTDIEPFSAFLTLPSSFRITAMWNGEDLNFQHVYPLISTEHPLVIEFSRLLDPVRTLLYISWAPPPSLSVEPEVQLRAGAVFRLQQHTSRVVIPAAALAEVASHITVPEGGFVLRIREYHVLEDVYEIVHHEGGVTEVLSGHQSNGDGLFVKMRR